MPFRWDKFVATAFPQIEQVIGKEFAYNQYNNAMKKLIDGYQKIANENAKIINPEISDNVEQIREYPSYSKIPVDEKGKIRNPLTDFYALAQDEIGKLQSNPYDQGIYSGKLQSMYDKFTTKEKQEKIFDTIVDKNGNVWKTNLVTGKTELVKEGPPKKKEDVRKGLSFYSSEIVDGVEKYFYTEYDDEGNPIKNEIPKELYDAKYKDPNKTTSPRSPRGYSPKGLSKDNLEKEKNTTEKKPPPSTTGWKWQAPKLKDINLSKETQTLIPQNVEAEFKRAAKEGNLDKIYNHYMMQYQKMGLTNETFLELSDFFNLLFDSYYSKK